MEDIDRARAEIDHIDSQIVPLLLERMEQSKKIGILKKTQNIQVQDTKREKQILSKVKTQGKEMKEEIGEIYQKIFEVSKKIQTEKEENI